METHEQFILSILCVDEDEDKFIHKSMWSPTSLQKLFGCDPIA